MTIRGKVIPLQHRCRRSGQGALAAAWSAQGPFIGYDLNLIIDYVTGLVYMICILMEKTRARQRAAGTKKTALFDIVNRD